MANSVNGLIEDTDYTTIRNKVINVLGTGSGTSGYGQITASPAVADGTTISASQWQNLRYDIFNCLVHQNGTNPTIVTVNANDRLEYGSGEPNNSYDTFANTLVSNRFNIGSGRFVTENLGSTSSGDRSWELEALVDITYTWPSGPYARHFFNSGGKIRVTSSFSPSVTKSQTTSWQNLLASAGTQTFGGNTPSVNWFSLTSSFQTFYTATPSSPYSANRYRLQARCNVSNNASGTATQLIIRVWLRDDYDDPAGQEAAYAPQDSVNGTISVTTDHIRATGPLQPSPSAGNFTILSSTATFSSWYTANGGVTPVAPVAGSPYNEGITITPSSFPAGSIFYGKAYGGVPSTNFDVTYRRSGVVVLTGSGTLDGAGEFSAPGSFSTAGSYTLTVYFYGTGNIRSTSFTVT